MFAGRRFAIRQCIWNVWEIMDDRCPDGSQVLVAAPEMPPSSSRNATRIVGASGARETWRKEYVIRI